MPATPRAPRPRRQRHGRALRVSFLGMVMLSVNQPLEIATIPLSDILFMVSAGIVFAGLLQGHVQDLAPAGMRRTPPVVLAGALVLLTSGVLSSLWSLEPLVSIATVVRFAWTILIWLWLLRAVCPTRKELLYLVKGVKITLFISCAAATLGQLGVVSTSPENYEQRQAGFFTHPNDLAALLAIGLPFILLAVPSQPERRYDWLWRLAFAGFLVFAIASTGSMTGILAMGVGLLVMGAVRLGELRSSGWWRHPLRTIALGMVGLVGLLALSGSDLPLFVRFARLTQGDGYVQGSIDSRSSLNQYVIDHFDQYLVLGTGPSLDKISPTSDLGYAVGVTATGGVHNMYLKTLLEFGLFGVIALVTILLTLGRRCLHLTRPRSDPDTRAIAAACLASLSAAMVYAFFSPVAFQRYFWVPAGFIGALWAIRRHEARFRAASPSPPDAAHDGNGGRPGPRGNGRRSGAPALGFP